MPAGAALLGRLPCARSPYSCRTTTKGVLCARAGSALLSVGTSRHCPSPHPKPRGWRGLTPPDPQLRRSAERDKHGRMSDAESSVRSAPRVVGRPFAPGQSGNPGGRPRTLIDVQELARQHTEQAIRTLVQALDDPKLRVQAACALLDRGWGRPVQSVEIDAAANSLMMHFWAATKVSAELRAEAEQRGRPMIDVDSMDDAVEPAPADLLNGPLPLE